MSYLQEVGVVIWDLSTFECPFRKVKNGKLDFSVCLILMLYMFGITVKNPKIDKSLYPAKFQKYLGMSRKKNVCMQLKIKITLLFYIFC